MREDKNEYEKNEMLNNMLLANILPVHAAKHFLTPGLRAKHVGTLNATNCLEKLYPLVNFKESEY